MQQTQSTPIDVFNLEVEEDHTYVANGIVVHNCNDLASRDGYNLGAGVYPPDQVPTYPQHPNDICTLVPVMASRDDVIDDILREYGEPAGVAPAMQQWGEPRRNPTFANDADAKAWMDRQYADWTRYLTNEEREIFNRYKGGEHSIVNTYLRKPKGVIPDASRGKQMSDAMHSSQRQFKARGGTDQEVVVYRGVDREVFGDLLDGDLDNLMGTVIKDKGFASTSLSEDYVTASRRHKGVIVETRVPKGSSAVSLEGQGVNTYGYNEYEMLMPKGSKMQIVGVEREADGFIRIITDLVP